MVHDPTLLNTQHCKEQIKGKVKQSRERSSALPYALLEWLIKREPSSCQLSLLFYIDNIFITTQSYDEINQLKQTLEKNSVLNFTIELNINKKSS